jgi:hypothetical protein
MFKKKLNKKDSKINLSPFLKRVLASSAADVLASIVGNPVIIILIRM